VRACISVLGHEEPPILDAASGVRPWYKNVSSRRPSQPSRLELTRRSTPADLARPPSVDSRAAGGRSSRRQAPEEVRQHPPRQCVHLSLYLVLALASLLLLLTTRPCARSRRGRVSPNPPPAREHAQDQGVHRVQDPARGAPRRSAVGVEQRQRWRESRRRCGGGRRHERADGRRAEVERDGGRRTFFRRFGGGLARGASLEVCTMLSRAFCLCSSSRSSRAAASKESRPDLPRFATPTGPTSTRLSSLVKSAPFLGTEIGNRAGN